MGGGPRGRPNCLLGATLNHSTSVSAMPFDGRTVNLIGSALIAVRLRWLVPQSHPRLAVACWLTLERVRRGTRSPTDCTAVRPAPKESVDRWPLANAISDAFGGMPVYR